MSDTSSSDDEKSVMRRLMMKSMIDDEQSMKQPDSDLSEAMDNLSISSDSSDETSDDSDESSTPSKNLSDMPIDIVTLIIERSEYVERLILCKVSKTLRALVDKQKPVCTYLQIHFLPNRIFCYYNDKRMVYVAPKSFKSWMKVDEDRLILSDDYEKIAFDDIEFTLKNPKLQLESLFIFYKSHDVYWMQYPRICDTLVSIGHQLSVRSCGIEFVSLPYCCSILSYLKPGVLEKITMLSNGYVAGWDENRKAIEQVALLEQWKQAKELEVESGFRKFPVEHATHFKRFQFNESTPLNDEEFVRIRDYILEHENVEFCSVPYNYAHVTGSVVGIQIALHSYQYTIPESEYYLEITFETEMSDTSTGDPGKPMKQPDNDLSGAMEQLSVTTEYSEKNSPSLSDMPIDVVSSIIERTNYKEQLKLRKVSKSLRELVDNQKPACKSIQVECCAKFVYIKFDSHTVTYSKDINNVRLALFAETIVNIVRDDFKKVAFDDLASALKNPKLQLDEFSVTNYTREKKDIRNVLESLNHQVSAGKIDIRILSHSCLFSVLPFLKPGILKKISISFDFGVPDWRIVARMEQVALLEQWKQAEELELKNCFDRFPMEYTRHFKRFTFHEICIDEDKFIRIRVYLSQLDNFEQCTLSSWKFRLASVHRLLGELVSSNTTEEVFHHPITGSDCYLEIKKATKTVRLDIKKKKRENRS